MFVNSYPWLFPGGVGDLYDMERGKWGVREWGQHLLHYYDGRFLKDQIFSLFVFNTIERHKTILRATSFSRAISSSVRTLQQLKSSRNSWLMGTTATFKYLGTMHGELKAVITSGEVKPWSLKIGSITTLRPDEGLQPFL